MAKSQVSEMKRSMHTSEYNDRIRDLSDTSRVLLGSEVLGQLVQARTSRLRYFSTTSSRDYFVQVKF